MLYSYFRPNRESAKMAMVLVPEHTFLPPAPPPPGLTVVTRSPDSNNIASSTVGTALPKFAIRGMLKTFGLHGVVLDVDSVSAQPFLCTGAFMSRLQGPWKVITQVDYSSH